IAQFAVGLPRLADSHIGEWIFIPAYRSYFNLNINYQAQDYTGILLGDVTGNWNQSYGMNKQLIAQSIAGFNGATISADEITVPVIIDDALEVLSWQIAIKFDQSQLRYLGTEKGACGSKYQFIENNQNGILEAGMYGGETASSDEPFAYIKFKILDPAIEHAELEISYFQVNNDPVQYAKVEIDINPSKPKTFSIFQNYPNPFNPTTTIAYQIPEAGHVAMAIYNLAGQQIITLEQDERKPGIYRVEWNGMDQAGIEVTSGVYFCHLYYRNELKTIKLVKVK
ncbi:MAG TPA: T9SS type A sorting domain-containing protein, partial [bacterium]